MIYSVDGRNLWCQSEQESAVNVGSICWRACRSRRSAGCNNMMGSHNCVGGSFSLHAANFWSPTFPHCHNNVIQSPHLTSLSTPLEALCSLDALLIFFFFTSSHLKPFEIEIWRKLSCVLSLKWTLFLKAFILLFLLWIMSDLKAWHEKIKSKVEHWFSLLFFFFSTWAVSTKSTINFWKRKFDS